MKKSSFLLLAILLQLMCNNLSAQFYKDIFMDGGIKVTSRERLPAAELLDLSMEYYASSRFNNAMPPTRQDTLIQTQLYIGDDLDDNGILLYPDGEPRFRLLYVNGGKAASHGNSMGEEGRSRMSAFVANGGTFVGTCAGAFFASKGNVSGGKETFREAYLGIWPGWAANTGLSNNYTGMTIEKNSPLLKYYDFGGDMYIDSVRHNGGNYAYTLKDYPAGTEILLRYVFDDSDRKTKFDKEPSAWAYKKDAETGRVVLIGSHPEGVTGGERLDLMAALLSYAIDGLGAPKVKAKLENESIREMFKSTLENDPPYTMIGDKQYHHFTVEIPKGAKNVKVVLDGCPTFDLFMYMKKGDFAFKEKATHKDIDKGSKKNFSFKTLEAGTWYIGVECATTVDVEKTSWGYKYVGRTDVLNGVPYTIKVSWE